MRKVFFFFAAAGWTIGLAVHLLSLFDYDVAEVFPFVWVLHVGAIFIMFPAIIELKKTVPVRQENGKLLGPTRGFYKHVFKNAPRWLVIIACLCFGYAIINFILFITSQTGTAEIQHGQYFLTAHGKILKTLTEAEYHHIRANMLRGFSGHWIFFFAAAAAILYPFKKQEAIQYPNA
jgi:hypothetical protein